MENTEIVHALSLILMITDKLFCLIFFFFFLVPRRCIKLVQDLLNLYFNY